LGPYLKVAKSIKLHFRVAVKEYDVNHYIELESQPVLFASCTIDRQNVLKHKTKIVFMHIGLMPHASFKSLFLSVGALKIQQYEEMS
jgi:hypothetical protein